MYKCRQPCVMPEVSLRANFVTATGSCVDFESGPKRAFCIGRNYYMYNRKAIDDQNTWYYIKHNNDNKAVYRLSLRILSPGTKWMYAITSSKLMYRVEIAKADFPNSYIRMPGRYWLDVNVYGHDVWAVERGGKIWYWNALSPELKALPEKAGLKFSKVSANSRFVWAIQERTGRLHFCKLPCHAEWIAAGHAGLVIKAGEGP